MYLCMRSSSSAVPAQGGRKNRVESQLDVGNQGLFSPIPASCHSRLPYRVSLLLFQNVCAPDPCTAPLQTRGIQEFRSNRRARVCTNRHICQGRAGTAELLLRMQRCVHQASDRQRAQRSAAALGEKRGNGDPPPVSVRFNPNSKSPAPLAAHRRRWRSKCACLGACPRDPPAASRCKAALTLLCCGPRCVVKISPSVLAGQRSRPGIVNCIVKPHHV